MRFNDSLTSANESSLTSTSKVLDNSPAAKRKVPSEVVWSLRSEALSSVGLVIDRRGRGGIAGALRP